MLSKHEVHWIINLRPGQSACRCETHTQPLICQFLYGHIKEVVDPPARNQVIHFAEQSLVHHAVENRYADISAAKPFSGYSLAHADHSAARDNYFHGFVSP